MNLEAMYQVDDGVPRDRKFSWEADAAYQERGKKMMGLLQP